jgi:AAA15 family ATPase/GTPase
MSRLKNIKIKHFRGIEELDIQGLADINIFVGDNNSFKTTILEAIFISLNPARPDLAIKANLMRGISEISFSTDQVFWASLFYKGNTEIPISFEWETENDHMNLLFSIVKESVMDDEGKLRDLFAINWKLNNREVKFVPQRATVGDQSWLKFEEKESKSVLQNLDVAGHFFPDRLNPNNAAEVINKNQSKEYKNKLLSFLQKFSSTISDIESTGTQIYLWDDAFPGKEKQLINTYGSAVSRALNWYSEAVNPQNKCILIDEVENGIYFARQKQILGFLLEANLELGTQFFFTTHSSEFVKSFYELIKNDSRFESLREKVAVFQIDTIREKLHANKMSWESIERKFELGHEFR